jgi:hypothetical protein
MNWTTLFITTFICYVIYYGVVMGIDLLINKNGSQDKGYQMVDMDLEEEEPENILVEDYKPIDEIDSSPKKKIKNLETEVSLGELSGQGLPVDDFLNYAKSKVASIQF